MVFKYLAAASLAATGTYFAVQPASPTQSCEIYTNDGSQLEIVQGPLGPRLGDLEYHARNLSHEEKIKLVSSPGYDIGSVAETMVTDIIRNRERVSRDIFESVKTIIEETF